MRETIKITPSTAMPAGRISAFCLGLLLMAAVLLLLAPRPADAATTFIVNKIGDAGDRRINGVCDALRKNGKQCTLRAAIQEANATLGGNSIDFDIGGTAGVKSIKPARPLPTITEAVTIDGYTQPGASENTLTEGNDAVLLIQLNGTDAGAGADGLVIEASNSEIRGLVINRFSGSGVEIQRGGFGGPEVTGNIVAGNFIGTSADGSTDLGNGFGVALIGAQNNTVGGTTPAARNVISGNDQDGVKIFGSGAPGNEILGNFIGTDKNGALPLGNGSDGVEIDGADDNAVGGTGSGARNVISGNDQDGVRIVVNSGTGTATGNQVLGNFVGTDAAGTADLGNGNDGVDISSGGQNNTVGSTAAGAGNVISGNDSDGVEMRDAARDNEVLGNFIGTKANGTEALSNTGDGVDISDADDNTVGGTVSGARNVISGNVGDGVVIFGSDATGNEVLGNFIGSGVSGNALGNDDGVVISSASNSTIGSAIGSTAGGNRIAHNQGDGVLVFGGLAVGNRILSNSIFSNDDLGIDLGTNGVTANDTDDPDASASNNHLQNFPVITSAIRSNTTNLTTVSGTLNSNPNQTYTVQCFVADTTSTTSNGEGQTPAGQDTTVTTDSGGDASFSCVSPIPQAGQTVTATATNTSGTGSGTAIGDTSEFSLNQTVFPGP